MQPIEISAHNKLKIPKLKKNKSMIMLFAINIKIDFNKIKLLGPPLVRV